MIAVPAAIPVTSPEAELIVATVTSEELQVPPTAVDEKDAVSPTQIF
jgi:hypothetical protein